MTPEELDRMKALEARVVALEKGEAFQATQSEIQKVQANCLQELRAVREALASDHEGSNQLIGGISSAEAAAAAKEKEDMRKRIAKLEYRVQHLLASLEALYEENKAYKAVASN